MSSFFEGRGSDSPYIEAVWHGQAGSDYAPVCPASSHWHLLFLKQHGSVNVTVVGPLTRAIPVTQYQAGYADQSHMTRALKHFIGYTPAHIARSGSKGELG